MDFNTGTGGTGGSGGTPPGGPGGAGGPRPSMAAAPGGDFDYRDPVQSFISTARGVALDPANFFRGIRRRGDFVNPLVFALICGLVFAVLSGIFGALSSVASGTSGVGGAIIGFVGSVVFTPIVLAVFLFIGAGIYHLLVMLFVKPSNAGYEATFRVVCYASTVLLVSWISSFFNLIPVIGAVIGGLLSLAIGIYGVVLQVIGMREVHATTTGRAVAIVLIPTVVVVLFVVVVIGAALLAVFVGTR